MKRVLFVLFAISLIATTVWAAPPKKFSDLLKDEAFAKATAEQRLEWINAKIDKKEFTSSEISGDIITRLYFDRLKDEKDAAARLNTYGQLRGKFNKISQTYEIEVHLATEFLAATPEGQKADLVAMLKMVTLMQADKKISWPAAAPLYEGMLSAHLATNADYQKMSAKEKLTYLKKLNDDKVVGNMTTNRFARCVAAVALTEAGPEKQKAVFDELAPIMCFFTKTAVTGGYEPQ